LNYTSVLALKIICERVNNTKILNKWGEKLTFKHAQQASTKMPNLRVGT